MNETEISSRQEDCAARIEKPFACGEDRLLHLLSVDPRRGLTDQEAVKRRLRFGTNELAQQRGRTMLQILLNQFRSLIIWLLTAAAAVSFYLNDTAEAFAIVAVLVINAGIGFFTELRAIRSMESLQRFSRVTALVRRSGVMQQVDASELVPGDIVIIEAGNVLPADLRLVKAANLRLDESTLTGESTPVTKELGILDPATELADRTNMGFRGTAVNQGSGEGIVVAIGMATELGRISKLAQEAESQISPLEKRLDVLGQRLIWLMLALVIAMAAVGVLRGQDVYVMLKTAIALAVAAVPEGLPVIATLCLARGMWRMAQRNVVISRLSAVETLGATTVILTDKTGTLTENRMAVAGYCLAGIDVEVDLHRPKDQAVFRGGGGSVDPQTDERLGWALKIGALCNDAALSGSSNHDGDADGLGDPMELALLLAAQRGGFPRNSLLQTYRETGKHAFDPRLQMMATIHHTDGQFLFAVKGAPEGVIAQCSSVLTKTGTPQTLEEASRREWLERAGDAARRGFRLLGFAMKREDNPESDPYAALTLVGLVCLLDPLRQDVPDAIDACEAAGVRVIMLTGDHAHTAAEIARQAGLGDGPVTVIEGRELSDLDLDNLSDAERTRILGANVFARISPETKLKLAALLQREGEIVTMTGDGVNDAPALKKADIGVAMGRRGTDVAREAAHMVLKDDAFSSIVAAMREGRIIFDNIRKYVVYLLSCNVSEVMAIGLAVGIGLPTPLLPLQILYLNLVTDVFPAFALGLSKGDNRVMRRPPRDPGEQIVDRRHWRLIGVLGSLLALTTLAAFIGALYWLELTPEKAISVAFVTLALAQLWNVFNLRDRASGLFRNEVTRNPYVWGAIVLCLCLIAIGLWIPGLSELLHLPSPGPAGLGLALSASLIPMILGQLLLTGGFTQTDTNDRMPLPRTAIPRAGSSPARHLRAGRSDRE